MRNLHRLNIIVFAVLLGIASGIIPIHSGWAASRADMGPKPTMSFEFVSETGPLPDILEGTLLECQDSSCQEAKPLGNFGPQHFSCTQNQCSSMAYGYSPYHKLVIRFNDGKSKESNIFQKKYFDARYQVTVRPNDLTVKELRGSSNFLNLVLLLSGITSASFICLIMFVFIPFIVVLLIFWLRSRLGKGLYKDTPALYIIAWILSILFLIGAGLASPPLLLTVLIEGILGWLYAWRRKVDKLRMITIVILANMITLPALVLALQLPRDVPSLLLLGICELIIWLLESVILYFTQSQSIRFREALGLSFGLNAASFLTGLILPI